MSKREEIQADITDFLVKHSNYFNAPYGIIEGMESFGRGKMRVVTFGVSRYLDASIKILGEKNLVLEGKGGLAHNWGIEWGKNFTNLDELKEFLRSKIVKD